MACSFGHGRGSFGIPMSAAVRGGSNFFAIAVIVTLGFIASQSLKGQEIESFPKEEAPVHADPNRGKRLYDSYGCYQCHGGQGQGSPLTGPRIGPDPMKFSSFVRYIRKPGGQMPPYTTKVTSDNELSDIYAFLQSLSRPPEVKTIPLLAMPSAEKKR